VQAGDLLCGEVVKHRKVENDLVYPFLSRYAHHFLPQDIWRRRWCRRSVCVFEFAEVASDVT
jgi:hypothetical protein